MYKHIEEITLNTWPAIETVLQKGWIIRSADGYTKRANSVSPLYGTEKSNQESIEELIRICEIYYSGNGLNTVFKMSPYTVPANLDSILDALGYRAIDESSVRLLHLDQLPEPSLIAARQDFINDEWLGTVAQLNNLTVRQKDITRNMLQRSTLQQGFFTLYQDDSPVACGLGVIQNEYVGLYDIVTDMNHRRNGFGMQLLLNILHWGISAGAKYSFLQVVQQNDAAIGLYTKLGYREIYKYWYRMKPD